jgi:hypothetical protein
LRGSLLGVFFVQEAEMIATKRTMTTADVVEQVGVTRKTLALMVRRGDFPPPLPKGRRKNAKRPGKLLWNAAAVERWLLGRMHWNDLEARVFGRR